jgi:chromosome segregation ATPase
MTTLTQQNENHEQVNSLSEENSIRTKTIINSLKQQRDEANNALVVLNGEKAVVEHKLARLTATHQQTVQKLSNVEAGLGMLKMANANLDGQIKSMKDAIEMFYNEVSLVTDIEQLRTRLGIGVEEKESEEEIAEPPKTLWQRFLAAFSRDSEI